MERGGHTEMPGIKIPLDCEEVANDDRWVNSTFSCQRHIKKERVKRHFMTQ